MAECAHTRQWSDCMPFSMIHIVAIGSFVLVCLNSIQTDVGEADMQGAAAQALGETTQYLRQTLADLLERLAPAVEVQETGPGAVQHGQGMEQEGEENFSDTSLD